MGNKNDRWSALSMSDRADLIKLYVSNGITSLNDIKKDYNSFGPGGPIETDEYGYPADITPVVVTQDAKFNKFLMTLPDNQRLTPEEEYHTYQYWKINGKPKDFSEALNLEMYHYDSSDNSYHANSVAFDSKGVGHFMKPKHHPTVKYELDWYNKGIGTLEGGEQYPLQGEERKEWEDFRSQYQLDSTGVDYRYVPRKRHNSFAGGGNTNSEGAEEDVPTLDAYLQMKLQEARQMALANSYNTTEPRLAKRYYSEEDLDDLRENLIYAKYDFKKSNEYAEETEKKLNHPVAPEHLFIFNPIYRSVYTDTGLNDEGEKLLNELSSDRISATLHKNYIKEYQDRLDYIDKYGYDWTGYGCITNATGWYGDPYVCASNIEFKKDPSKYGFVEISADDALPGDIFQYDEKGRPNHATMYSKKGDYGEYYSNYSSGNYKDIIRHDSDYWGKGQRAFRFVGLPEDVEAWTQEYNEKYKNSKEGTNNHSGGGKINRFKTGGPTDTKHVEDVVRTTRGSTGKILTKNFPFVDLKGAGYLWDSWRVMKGSDKKVAPSDDNYTGAAMKGVGVQTDDGLGFASQQDLANTLGYTPKDFVDTYVYGDTPFEELGVFKKEDSPERHVVRSKVQKVEDSGKQVNTYQTQRDTLDTNTVAALDSLLNAGLVDLHSRNTTYQESPFNIGDSGIIYDGNNSTIATAYLPNGMPVSKAIDVFDTDPQEWNYKIGPLAKTGLSFIHDNTNPFLMTTPWYYPIKSTDFLSRLYYLFGIEADPEYNVISNKGDKNGVVWDLHEALEWLDSHPDLTEMPVKSKKD